MTVNKLEPDNGTPNDELFTVAGMFDGSLYKLLLRMALPMFVGMLTQVTYAIADIFWLSHIDVTNSGIIAGVGLVFPLEWGYLPSPTAFKSVWIFAVPRHRHAAVGSCTADFVGRYHHRAILCDRDHRTWLCLCPAAIALTGGHEEHHRLRNGVLLLFAADRVQHHVDWRHDGAVSRRG